MSYWNKEKKVGGWNPQKKRTNWNQNAKTSRSGKMKKIKKSLQYLLLLRKFHQVIDYKNIRLLKAFLTKYGKIRPRRKTRIPIQKQKSIAKAIRKARAFKIIPFTCDVTI